MVREYGTPPATTQSYGPSTPTGRPHPTIQADVLDADGNLRAEDIDITWEDNETFLDGVRVVGSRRSRPTGQEPAMSTPYPRGGSDDRSLRPLNHLHRRRPNSIQRGKLTITGAHRRHVRDTDRPHQSSDSTINHLTGWRGFVISALLLMSTAGWKNREHCSLCLTKTKLPWT